MEIDFDKDDEDYNEYVWQIYEQIENEFSNYTILNSRDDIIEHLEKRIEDEE